MPSRLKQLILKILFFIFISSLSIFLVIYSISNNQKYTSVINYDYNEYFKNENDTIFEIKKVTKDSITITKYKKDSINPIIKKKELITKKESIKQIIDTPKIITIKEDIIRPIDTNKTVSKKQTQDSVKTDHKKVKKKWLFFNIKQ